MKPVAAFVLAAATLAVGCGPRTPATYPVTGRLTFADGQPVRSGVIEFYSSEHKIAARGQIQADGSFRLSTYGNDDGAVAGRHVVTVAQPVQADPYAQPHHHGPAQKVNPRFANPQTSGLEFTVRADGANELSIRLEP